MDDSAEHRGWGKGRGQGRNSAMSDNDAKLTKEQRAAFAQSAESFRLLVEQALEAIIILADIHRLVLASFLAH